VRRYAAKVAASSMLSRPKNSAPRWRPPISASFAARVLLPAHPPRCTRASAQRDRRPYRRSRRATTAHRKPRRSPRCPMWHPAPFSEGPIPVGLPKRFPSCLDRQFHRGNWKRCAAPAADYVPSTIWHLEILLRHRVGNPDIYAHSMSRPRSRQWTRTLSSSP